MSIRGVFNDVIINTSGNALANVEVDVFQVGTTTPVTIYSGRTGGGTLANPITTTSTGLVYFFADPGTYSIRITDTLSPVRFATRTFVWDSISGDSTTAAGGIDLSQIEATTANKVLTTDTDGKIVADTIATTDIANEAVTTAKLDDAAVTTPKILDNAVNIDKIGTNAVDSGQLVSQAVETAKLADGAVTGPKIDPATIQFGVFTVTPGGFGPVDAGNQPISTMANISYGVFYGAYRGSWTNFGPMDCFTTARQTTSFDWLWIGGGDGDLIQVFYLVVGNSL